VHALTGVDTDRLAEEKARGITIDLGFAPLALDGLHASIVDVPGHEGFIRNMVAGATGIDVALLVVAADEGVMPQTREHLAILRHLGVRRGVVALTKIDLAPDQAWRELVAEDVRALIGEQIGRPWPVVEVSAVAAQGLEELRAALVEAAHDAEPRSAGDLFRLPVDRVFTLPGAGTIVTGTVWSGAVQVGDAVRLLPGDVETRIRSIQVHGTPAERADRGRRAALALVGVSRDQAPRGAVVVSGAGWRANALLDAAVEVSDVTVLKPRRRVRVHHGTAEVMARLAQIGPSRNGVTAVRLALDAPLVARAGDRFVLRSFSPVTTIGGGVIVDPWVERRPAHRRRPGPPVLPATDDAHRVERLVSQRGPAGMREEDLRVAAGLDAERFAAALAAAQELGVVTRAGWLIVAGEVDAAAARMRATLAAFHAAHPLEPGMSAQAWRGAAAAGNPALAELAERWLEAAHAVVREGGVVRLPTWQPATSDEARATRERVLRILRDAGPEPPTMAELAAQVPGADVAGTLRLLARAGEAVAVADRYYEAGALAAERDRLVAAFRELGTATPAQIRERLQRSRKWLIPLLEWADREGLTVREGDHRTLRSGMGS